MIAIEIAENDGTKTVEYYSTEKGLDVEKFEQDFRTLHTDEKEWATAFAETAEKHGIGEQVYIDKYELSI